LLVKSLLTRPVERIRDVDENDRERKAIFPSGVETWSWRAGASKAREDLGSVVVEDSQDGGLFAR
jgi:hypothetical protein